jgi:hydrogenase maturation protease
MEDAELILIGVGNPFRGDDGLGRVLVRCLREEIPPAVRVVEETGEGTALLEAWRGAHGVILVDAMQSGEPAGTIRRFDARAEKLPACFFHSSTHSFGLAEAIELARTMGEMPGHFIVYGIEGQDYSAGRGLSPEVAEVLPEAADLILREVKPRGIRGSSGGPLKLVST